MVEKDAGFKIPIIDHSICIECGACMRACHVITSVVERSVPISNYACWTINCIDRSNSSSGGAFSVLARKCISQGGVVFGATMNEDLQVKHISIDKEQDLILLQGSKYVQSYTGDIYKTVKKELLSGRKVLFSGTPCQVAALQTFLHKRYENLITCDLVCHGVPSQKAFDNFIDKIGIRDHTNNFNFRFTEGWGFRLSRQDTALSVSAYSKKKVIYPSKAYYLRAFTKGLMFSEACYNCQYSNIRRVSDFTLADYWGLGAKIPFQYTTKKGVSCLLVNSQQGLEYLKSCTDLELVQRPLEEAIEGNHNLSHCSTRPQGRNTYYTDALKLNRKELSSKYGINSSLRDYLRLIKQNLFILSGKLM